MSNAGTGTVGVVGLGNMGLGMATSIARAGFTVLATDIDAGRRAAAEAEGLRVTPLPRDVFAEASHVVLSLPNGALVDRIVRENVAGGRTVVVDTSTSDAATSRALADLLAGQGHGFLDAPVSGGPSGAAAGKLTAMVGGSDADVADARAVLDAMCGKVLHVGPSGAGNVAKLVNNMLVAAHMITTREGLRLAQAAGVDAAAVLDVLNEASGGSTLSRVHFPTWILSGRFDSGFSTGLMRKDVRLARELAEEHAVDLPLTALAARMWTDEPLADDDDFTLMGAPDRRTDDEVAR